MTDKAARSWRGRLPVVAVVVACVAGVVAAVSGTANPVSAVQFLLPGHWVYNSALQSVFHVDGSTGDVDARARIPGGPGDQVFQGDRSGYVVGSSRITEFGKSSLTVEESAESPSKETPVGIETAGGPYLVYQEDGKVVRLGEASTVLSLGGPVGMPVATRDGTVWLPRTSAGLLCSLSAKAKNVSCPVLLPKGHAGALSVVGDQVVYVDTTADTLHVVEKDGLGDGRDLGIDVADDARLASTDVGGRLAILDGARMHLVRSGLDGESGEPVTVDLGDGEYTGPVSTGSVVAVVNRSAGTLITYDGDGKRREVKELPPEKGDPRLTRGEDDRIYVDGDEGQHVVVVDKDGDLTDVPIKNESGDGAKSRAKPKGGGDPDEKAAAPSKPKPDVEKPKPDPTPPPEKPKPPPPPEDKPVVVEQPPEVPASPPGAPTGVSATAGNGDANVRFGPAPDNRSPITGYRITWAGGSTTVGPATRVANIAPLTNGTRYVFTVAAINAVGTGPGVATNAVTPVAPVGPASQPLNVQVVFDQANRSAVMTWDAPANLNGGTLAGYYVTATGWGESSVGGRTWVFDNIDATGTLTFTVRARTTDAAGRTIEGATATATADGGPDPGAGEVRLSRGPETQEYCAGDPDCAWMHVELVNMQPNTHYDLMPHSTADGYSNPGGDCTTDENGYCVTDQFAYHVEGDTVWVTVTGPDGTELRSNDLVWEKAG